MSVPLNFSEGDVVRLPFSDRLLTVDEINPVSGQTKVIWLTNSGNFQEAWVGYQALVSVDRGA